MTQLTTGLCTLVVLVFLGSFSRPVQAQTKAPYITEEVTLTGTVSCVLESHSWSDRGLSPVARNVCGPVDASLGRFGLEAMVPPRRPGPAIERLAS